jgi:hypothetical protein
MSVYDGIEVNMQIETLYLGTLWGAERFTRYSNFKVTPWKGLASKPISRL